MNLSPMTIQLFWLFPLNGFDFIFLLRDSETIHRDSNLVLRVFVPLDQRVGLRETLG